MQNTEKTRLKATLIGFAAPLLWATFPSLSLAVGGVPPFQLMFITFTISFLLSICMWKYQGKSVIHVLKQPLKYWTIGIFGIFGFNAVYVTCLKLGPAAEVFLVTSTWPIITMLLDSVVLKERLRPWHIAGSLSAFCGVILIAFYRDTIAFNPDYFWRYAASLGAATIWATYSILNRKVTGMPDNLVGGFCGASAILAFLCHILFEQTVSIPLEKWPLLLALGIGPVGLSYYAWNFGTKYGDIRSLSILAFLGTFISISLLILFGFAPFNWTIALAAVLIIGGAAIGSAGMFFKKR
ncbi:MAG: rane protein [Rickettsiaceae bacterium]|jgi:drug/metabolite transporter (DMT)-like permease|nr:rane protein [Rickettsiaceae bacterium]